MIPRTLHRVWLGGAPIPQEFEAYWLKAWELLPGWEFKTWRDDGDLDWLRCREVFDRAQSWSSKSDVVRFELLARFGGVYVDTDVELVRSLEPLLGLGAFAGWEVPAPTPPAWPWGPSIGTAVMASSPAHPAAEALVAALPGWFSGRSSAPANVATGPVFLSRTWDGRDDVTLLPQEAFFFGGPGGRSRSRPPGTYAVHHWAGSWLPKHPLAPRRAAPFRPAPSVSILVPFKFSKVDPHRAKVWAWVRRYWSSALPEAEIVVGTDDGVPFSRARAINEAARRAKGDILVIVDSDVIVPTASARSAIRKVSGPAKRWMVPFTDAFRLSREVTDALIATSPSWPGRARWRPADCEQIERRTGPVYGSMIQVLPAEAFRLVGGLDPRFRGWGHEDNAFCWALDTLWGRHGTESNGATHLWHPRRFVNAAETNLWDGQDEPSQDSIDLQARYAAARGRPEAMRMLIAERELVSVERNA